MSFGPPARAVDPPAGAGSKVAFAKAKSRSIGDPVTAGGKAKYLRSQIVTLRAAWGVPVPELVKILRKPGEWVDAGEDLVELRYLPGQQQANDAAIAVKKTAIDSETLGLQAAASAADVARLKFRNASADATAVRKANRYAGGVAARSNRKSAISRAIIEWIDAS